MFKLTLGATFAGIFYLTTLPHVAAAMTTLEALSVLIGGGNG
jgi:hypothetical protein